MTAIRLVTAFGEAKSISAWSRDVRCGVTYKCLYSRLVQLQWVPELAITTPRQRLDNSLDYRGQTSEPTPSVVASDRRFANSLATKFDVGF